MPALRRVTRTIHINGTSYKVWFAIARKRYNSMTALSLMYYSEDPEIKKTPPIKIKEGFRSDAEAIQYGMNYLKKSYLGMAKDKTNDPDEEIDWDDIK